MDDLGDLLKYIIPFAIFVVSAIFGGKSNKQKHQSDGKRVFQPDYDRVANAYGDGYFSVTESDDYYQNEPESPMQPSETTEPMQPEEGERAIFVETHNDNTAESEKPEFDAREAVIYSTILERKY